MTGPAAPGDDDALYVQPQTFQRLMAQERLSFQTAAGITRAVFPDNDPLYPAASVKISPQVIPNSVHRRRWISVEERFVFEFAGTV